MASTPVIVYLNGEYWGHYNLRERINEHSIAAYEGWSDPKNVDLIKGDNDVLNGSYDNYGELLDFVWNPMTWPRMPRPCRRCWTG